MTHLPQIDTANSAYVGVVEPNYCLDRLSPSRPAQSITRVDLCCQVAVGTRGWREEPLSRGLRGGALKAKLLCEVSWGSRSEGKSLSERGWASLESHVRRSSLMSLRRSTLKRQCREASLICTTVKQSNLVASRPVKLESRVKSSLGSSQLVTLLFSIKEVPPSESYVRSWLHCHI